MLAARVSVWVARGSRSGGSRSGGDDAGVGIVVVIAVWMIVGSVGGVDAQGKRDELGGYDEIKPQLHRHARQREYIRVVS